MRKPTIILLGGAPWIGKSTVALKLAVRLGYPCISTDDLAQAVVGVSTEQTHPAFHKLRQTDHRRYFFTHSTARLAADADYCQQACWPAVRNVIQYHLDTNKPAVIEGNALFPEKISVLEHPRLFSAWLIASPDLFAVRMEQEADFFAGIAMSRDLMDKFVGRSNLLNEKLQTAARNYHLPVIEVFPRNDADSLADALWNLLVQKEES